MEFWDIASIVFVCTAVNHLGLIEAIQTVTKRHELPVIGCVKCLTFWCVLTYCCVCCDTIAAAIKESPSVLAISLLSAWAAIWLDLCMGAIDNLYLRIYDTLYPATDEANTDTLGTADAMSDMQQ